MPTDRERLFAAISALREEEQRHKALTAAQARAMEERHGLVDAVTQAKQQLATARRAAPLDRVYAFVNRQEVMEPVAEHEAAHKNATALLERAESLGRDIDDELQRSTTRLRECEAAVTRALAPIVVESPEFQALFGQRTAAWIRLRTLYVLFNEIFSALSANVPEAMCIRFQGHEPLEADRFTLGDEGKMVPYECDEELLKVANTCRFAHQSSGPATAWKWTTLSAAPLHTTRRGTAALGFTSGWNLYPSEYAPVGSCTSARRQRMLLGDLEARWSFSSAAATRG